MGSYVDTFSEVLPFLEVRNFSVFIIRNTTVSVTHEYEFMFILFHFLFDQSKITSSSDFSYILSIRFLFKSIIDDVIHRVGYAKQLIGLVSIW